MRRLTQLNPHRKKEKKDNNSIKKIRIRILKEIDDRPAKETVIKIEIIPNKKDIDIKFREKKDSLEEISILTLLSLEDLNKEKAKLIIFIFNLSQTFNYFKL